MDSSIGFRFSTGIHSQCSEIAKTGGVAPELSRNSRGGWVEGKVVISTAEKNTDRNQKRKFTADPSGVGAGSWARPDRSSSTEPASHCQ